MNRKVHVVGVGMTQFTSPSASDAGHVLGAKAVKAALKDGGLHYDLVDQAYTGYVFGDSTSGQAALYAVGLTGIPVINVNNSCATGSTALFLARQAVESGAIECALALGFEQTVPDAPKVDFADRPSLLAQFIKVMKDVQGYEEEAPRAAQFFGGAGLAHMKNYGTRLETFAKIAVKARRHAAHNPFALFREEISEDQVLASPRVFGPLTRLQCCPPSCGAAAAIVCSDAFAEKHGLDKRVVIAAQAMVTDRNSSFDERDMRKVVGYDMTKDAALQVYETAGIGPEDLDVVELHDCFTSNELITYEALGLTPEGTAERFIVDGDNTYGGRIITNPSGGLLSRGDSRGATGLAQCVELVWQLRGHAAARQVEDARLALQHNLGLGSACIVTLYQST
jgi:acetyl-CoA acetyltransferase